MQKAIDALIDTLAPHHAVQALYLYGSAAQHSYQAGSSDFNLLLMLADSASWADLYSLFQPVWQCYSPQLRRAPLGGSALAMARYLWLYPVLADHVQQTGRLLHQSDNYVRPTFPAAAAPEKLAYLSATLMQASAALVPLLLTAAEAASSLAQLRRLTRQIWGQPVNEAETAVALYGRLQSYLGQAIAQLPLNSLPAYPPLATLDTPLSGLQAIYQNEQEKVVLVFEHLGPELIAAVAWPELAAGIANEASGLLITTTAQLHLTLTYEYPLDIIFRRYRHDWGHDPLTAVVPTQAQLIRHAARLPAHIQVDLLPNAYLTHSGTEQAHRLIHDYQNKLLNVQLEHEILSRMGYIPRFRPTDPLPDRTAPVTARISAIFAQLESWSAYYAAHLASLKNDEA